MDGGKDSTDKEIKFPNCAADVRIVVVDCDLICLRAISGLLASLKYQVVPFQSPTDAISALRSNSELADLILTDIHMPVMNGLEFMEVIRREFRLPVILMSEDNDWGFIAESISKGALFYIFKWARLSDLESVWTLLRSWKCCRLLTRHKKIPDLRPSEGAMVAEVNMYWTDVHFHRLFLDCIEYLGPKNVKLEDLVVLMDIYELTTNDVALHLQIYRACLEYPEPKIQQQKQANLLPPAQPDSCGSCSGGTIQQFNSNCHFENYQSLGAGDATQAESCGSCSFEEDDECVADDSVTSKADSGSAGGDD